MHLKIEHITPYVSYAKDFAVSFLLFSYEIYSKCRENYSNCCGTIFKNMHSQEAKVFSFIFLHTNRLE